MVNRIITVAVYVFAAIGVLTSAYLIYDFSTEANGDDEAKSPAEFGIRNVDGLLMVANDNKFNGTNPDIRLATNTSKGLVILNAESDEHNFLINDLGVNSGILKEGKYFNTTLTATKPGVYEYYCSLHQDDMRGRIVVQ